MEARVESLAVAQAWVRKAHRLGALKDGVEAEAHVGAGAQHVGHKWAEDREVLSEERVEIDVEESSVKVEQDCAQHVAPRLSFWYSPDSCES